MDDVDIDSAEGRAIGHHEKAKIALASHKVEVFFPTTSLFRKRKGRGVVGSEGAQEQ
jgi:hypothetical protein